MRSRHNYLEHVGQAKSAYFGDASRFIPSENQEYDNMYDDDFGTQTLQDSAMNSSGTTVAHVSGNSNMPEARTGVSSWDDMSNVYHDALSKANHLAEYRAANPSYPGNNMLSSPMHDQYPSNRSEFQSYGPTTNTDVYRNGNGYTNGGIATPSPDFSERAIGSDDYCTGYGRNGSYRNGYDIESPRFGSNSRFQYDATSPTVSVQNGRGVFNQQVNDALDELDAVVTSFTRGTVFMLFHDKCACVRTSVLAC